MSKVLYYKQCKLEKDDWLVKEVYPQKMEAKLVENQAHDSGDIWKATSGKYPRDNK